MTPHRLWSWRAGRWGWLDLQADAYDRATAAVIAFAALLCVALWIKAGGTYFVKSLTESHNIVLAAANVRDIVTFLVQDLAASPDPEAHPFWYTNHPNLIAKSYSLVMGRLGLDLEGQIGVMLLLNVAALGLVAAVFRRLAGSAAALGAVSVAVLSYGAFHFNAGDLCRGPLYLLLWLLLYALVTNPGLVDRRRNLIVAAVCAASILSDWGFALFVVGFALCWGCVSARKVPVGWGLAWVVLPSALALSVYAAAVIAAVGWDFFLFDVKVTYLGRLGVWSYDLQSAIEEYRRQNVLIWPSQSQGTDRLQQFVAALLVAPLLNTGPVWILLMPLTVWALLSAGRALGGDWRLWLAAGIASLLNAAGLMPFPVLVIVFLWIAAMLRKAEMDTAIDRLSVLLLAIVTALLLPGTIFPGFTTGFIIAGGRPPFPLLEMAAAALFVEFVVSGVAARNVWRPALRLPFGVRLPALVPALIALFLLLLVALAQADTSFVGLPRRLAAGLAFVLIGATLLMLVEFAPSEAAIEETRADRMLRILMRWRYAAFLLLATALLASHVSAQPVILGRYSIGYAVLLSAVALLAVVGAMLTASWPVLRRLAANWLNPPRRGGSLGWPATAAPLILLALAAVGQVGWFGLSVAGRPPQPIPYAEILKSEHYRGKGFLTSSYEAFTWEATRGWAYMAPGNPPKLSPISPRFRHFADWTNERKYGRPDYYLCDNTGFSYVRPGTEWERGSSEPLTCRICTCRDVAAALAQKGHVVEVDQDSFAIIRFNWPAE